MRHTHEHMSMLQIPTVYFPNRGLVPSASTQTWSDVVNIDRQRLLDRASHRQERFLIPAWAFHLLDDKYTCHKVYFHYICWGPLKYNDTNFETCNNYNMYKLYMYLCIFTLLLLLIINIQQTYACTPVCSQPLRDLVLLDVLQVYRSHRLSIQVDNLLQLE